MSADNVSPPPGAPEVPSTVATVSEGLSFTNSILMVLIAYLLWKMFGKSLRKRNESSEDENRLVIPDPLPKHDMTLEELRKYDGKGEDKRVCIAILGRVYDCTKSYHFYGPEGTYRNFAGHDATRALAKFDVMAVKDEWDDVSDLTASEMSSVQEWKEQFEERYDYVGRLVESLDKVLDTAEDDVEEKAAAATRQDTEQVPHTTSQKSSESSSNESDLEVINPDQTELAEQK